RHLMTAQLLRVAAVMDRDPMAGYELLHDENACPINLRDFAWGWYARYCNRLRPTLVVGSTVRAGAVSPAGERLASGGGRGGEGDGVRGECRGHARFSTRTRPVAGSLGAVPIPPGDGHPGRGAAVGRGHREGESYPQGVSGQRLLGGLKPRRQGAPLRRLRQ